MEDQYLTTDYYAKDLLNRRIRSDSAGYIFDVLDIDHGQPFTIPGQGLTGRQAKFYPDETRTTKTFEFTTTNPDSLGRS